MTFRLTYAGNQHASPPGTLDAFYGSAVDALDKEETARPVRSAGDSLGEGTSGIEEADPTTVPWARSPARCGSSGSGSSARAEPAAT
jgi:hypothetical protein